MRGVPLIHHQARRPRPQPTLATQAAAYGPDPFPPFATVWYRVAEPLFQCNLPRHDRALAHYANACRPSRGRTRVGIQNCLANIAGIIGPVVTGWIVDKTGSFNAAFVLASLVVIAGAFGWGLVIKEKGVPLTIAVGRTAGPGRWPRAERQKRYRMAIAQSSSIRAARAAAPARRSRWMTTRRPPGTEQGRR